MTVPSGFPSSVDEDPDRLDREYSFIDRIEQLPIIDGLTSDTWGTENVLPREVNIGIEDDEYNYWGGDVVMGDNGHYHLFVARWPSEYGMAGWTEESHVVRATADDPIGPFEVQEQAFDGYGHNPEVTKIGETYVYTGHNPHTESPFQLDMLVANSLQGPWERITSEVDFPAEYGGSNPSLVERDDGSLLLITTGRSLRAFTAEAIRGPWNLLNEDIFPEARHRATLPRVGSEDPVVWKTENQYHLLAQHPAPVFFGGELVEGVYGFYARSEDGIDWELQNSNLSGGDLAYNRYVFNYENGQENWWGSPERPKVLTKDGKATHLYVCSTDISKLEGGDDSKTLVLPLKTRRDIDVEVERSDSDGTEWGFTVVIHPGENFNPHEDVDVDSLRFGSPNAVNQGYGAAPLNTPPRETGDSLEIQFDTDRHWLWPPSDTVGKLVGETTDGEYLFGFDSIDVD